MKDTFGKALYHYWKGDHKTPYTVRRDDGYADTGSLKIYFTKTLYPTEKMVIHHVSGTILDVGCGAGRHLLRWQNRGFNITGIDSSPLAIKTCKERGCKKASVMDALHPKFPPHSFDAILLFGHNIGIGGTVAGAKKLLMAMRKLIRPNGVLLMTSNDIAKTKNLIHQQYHQKNRAKKKYIGEVKIRVEYKDEIGDWFNWLHVAPAGLKQLAKTAGWTVKEIHKSDGGEFSAVLNPC